MHKGIILLARKYYQISFICELFRDSYHSHFSIIPYSVFYGVVVVAPVPRLPVVETVSGDEVALVAPVPKLSAC